MAILADMSLVIAVRIVLKSSHITNRKWFQHVIYIKNKINKCTQ